MRLASLFVLLAASLPAADTLEVYIGNLKRAIPRSGSNAFVAPAAADRA